MSQKSPCTAGSQVSITIRPAARCTSEIPARQSVQWWIVKMASAASKARSRNGRCSATPSAAGAAPPDRCASMTGDGSTAATTGPAVSYEPVPPPTFTIRPASPSATRICASMRGSARRVAV